MMWWRVPRFLFAKRDREEVGRFLQGPVVVVAVVVRGACAGEVLSRRGGSGSGSGSGGGYVPTSASNRKLR